ncbi:uncharacterized protein LOC142652280 [Rhinoderma darwinii]|uniref:uncharacterized protein LOC142652280 n=1 Tax=Rhinoderma darwinii TaxID=43563 RepID=UPI003F67DA9B
MSDAGSRILPLAARGEWITLEQTLKGIDKGDLGASETDPESGLTPFMIAVRENRLSIVERFLDLGVNLQEKSQDGRTALHVAAASSKDEVVRLLLVKKAEPNLPGGLKEQLPLHYTAQRPTGAISVIQTLLRASHMDARLIQDMDGCIPLLLAIESGNLGICKELLSSHAEAQLKVTSKKYGDCALHTSCRKREVDVAKLLVEYGACVDCQNGEGQTPLHIAAWEGDEMTVKFLYQSKANPNITDMMDRSPLHIAAERGHNGIVEILTEKFRANVLARTKDGDTLMHIASQCGHPETALAFLKKGVLLHMPNKSGALCLHAAAQRGHSAVVKALLQKGAQVDARTKENYTALHIAVENCKPQVVQTLLGFGAQVQPKGGKDQETPLHIAARIKDGEKVAEILLRSGADVNVERANGETAMHVAAQYGNIKMIRALMEEGGEVTRQSQASENALHTAVRHCHLPIVEVILNYLTNERSQADAVACVNQPNQEGETSLHLAAAVSKDMIHIEEEDVKIIRLLLDHDADISTTTSQTGATPLHYCARMGNEDVLLEMIKHIGSNRKQQIMNRQEKNMKADVYAADIQGQTPLHLAAENDHSEVVKLFLKHRPELVTSANMDGSTCAHIAAAKGSVAVIKELLKSNMSSVTTARNKTNESTPLHLAASGGHAEVVKVLLEAGASASDEDAEGMSAIHLAAKNGHINVLDVLKGSVLFHITSTKTGFTALHVAAHFGQADFVREILTKVPATIHSEPPKSTADMVLVKEHGGESGYTPLHLASQSGHESLVRLLLNYPGVQADAATSRQGSTPIHLAAQNGHTAVVGLLLSKSTSQLHMKDNRGRTCLHLAASNGHIEMMRALIGQGAEINVTDKNGWSALHFAAKSGFLETVRFLVECGANPTLECNDGKTAIQYAAGDNHQDVVSFLLKRSHNTLKLTEDRKFVFDLMVCGKLNNNRIIEEYILNSNAPLDTAVKLSRAFNISALKEKERSVDLLNAAKYTETMATELLTLASGSKNAGYILRAIDHRGTTILDCLIECEQKDVVAHPAVQKYLTEVWYGNLDWTGWKLVLLFFTFLACPPVWFVFSLPLQHRFNKIPIMKFMSYLASHIFLLVLFILTIVYPPLSPIFEGRMIPSWNEWLLLAWLSGMLVSELTHQGERAGLAWIRVFVLGFSAVAFFCHLLAFLFTDIDRLHCLFARNIFLGIAMTLSFIQFLEFLTFHHLFGPWAIIIRDLIKDLTRFAVILALFHVAFTMQLSAVYQPVYPESKANQSFNGSGANKNETNIQDPIDITVLLFFSLFGLVEPDCLPSLSRTPQFTFIIVRFVFGVYLVVTLIVLINLLIAMMSDTYQRIQAQSDTEWKFGRATLIRDMTRKPGTPSPFNLFTNLFYYIKLLCKHKGKMCSSNARTLMNEEDVDGFSDTRSIDLLAHSSFGWLRTTAKRTMQVSPEGGIHRDHPFSGPVHVAEIIDWHSIVIRFMSLKGQLDGVTSAERSIIPHIMETDKKSLTEQMTRTKQQNGHIPPCSQ